MNAIAAKDADLAAASAFGGRVLQNR